MAAHALRIFLSAFAALVAYFATGGALFAAMPWLKEEFKKHSALFREEAQMMKAMPIGMAGMFLAMLSLAVIYAHIPAVAPGALQGAGFGALVGVYVFGAFVLHNHMNLNVSWRLTLWSGAAYLLEWIVAGTALGAIFRF